MSNRGEGGEEVDNSRRDVLIETICNQVENLCLAELIQVADFVSNLRNARKFMRNA